MVAAGGHTHCHVCLHRAEATLQAVWLIYCTLTSLLSTNTHLSKVGKREGVWWMLYELWWKRKRQKKRKKKKQNFREMQRLANPPDSWCKAVITQRTLNQNILQLERLVITASHSSSLLEREWGSSRVRRWACCLGRTLRPSQASSQHSWPQQMALDVNCFNCVGFVCSASRKGTPAGTSVFCLLDQKCKPSRAQEDRRLCKEMWICNYYYYYAKWDIIFSQDWNWLSFFMR